MHQFRLLDSDRNDKSIIFDIKVCTLLHVKTMMRFSSLNIVNFDSELYIYIHTTVIEDGSTIWHMKQYSGVCTEDRFRQNTYTYSEAYHTLSVFISKKKSLQSS